MVELSVFIGIYIQIAISILVPIGFIIYLKKTDRLAWKPLLVGAFVFIFFALVLERFLHGLVLSPTGTALKWTDNPYIFALYGALAAGLFEEFGRYYGYRVMLKKYRSYGDGLSLGAGHGGIEAIIIGGLGAVNTLLIANMINSGQFEQMMGNAGLPEEQMQLMKDQILNTEIWMFLMGSFERIAALIMQVMLSLIVLLAVRKGSMKYLWGAVGFHMLFNLAPGLYQAGVLTNLWIVEAIIGIFAVLAIFIIRKIKDEF